MSDDEVLDEVRAMVMRFLWRPPPIARSTAIYHDLWIGGDDAGELLEAVIDRFGTDFSGMRFDRYFPNEGLGEDFGERIVRWLGLKSKWQRLTVGHLVDVIQKDAWFDPPSTP